MTKFLKYKTVIALGIYLVLAFMFFGEVLFGGKSYISADSNATKSLSAPLMKYHEETGEMPMWSPYIFCGMPSYGSMMYNGRIYMPGYLFIPFSKILPKLFFILHYVFAGLGVFLFLSRRKVSFHSALFGGLAFMFTPYVIAMFAQGHGGQMMTAAYLPWMLYSIDRLMTETNRRFIYILKNIALAGLIFGFALQRGHIQIFYYGILLCSLYAIFQSVAKRSIGYLAVLIPVLAIAVALAAMIYLPVAEYTPYSIRGMASAGSNDAGVGLKYATEWKMTPKELLTFLVPSAFGFGGETYHGTMTFTDFPNYAGIFVLILAFVGGFYSIRYKNDNRLLAIFLVSATLLAILLSFGGSLYKLFYNYFPYWNKFRVPSMLLILVSLNLAILAAFGLEELPKREVEEKYLWVALAILATGLLVLFAVRDAMAEKFGLSSVQFDMLYIDAVLGIIFLIAGGTILLFLQYEKIPFALAAFLISIVTLLDLWQVDRRIGIKGRDAPAERLHDNPLVDFFKNDPTLFRVHLTGRLFGEVILAESGIESTGGYHPAKPRLYQDLMDALQGKYTRNIISMLNCKYQLAQLPDGRVNVYINPEYLPRAYFVREYEVEADPKKRLKRLVSDFDFKHKVLLTETTSCESAPVSSRLPGSMGQATLLKKDYSLNQIRISVSNRQEQFLVLTDGYYPVGWQAYVDGHPVKTYQANHAFRAVCVPGGAKTVEFKYVSKTYETGWTISLITLAVCLIGVFIPIGKQKNA